MKTVASISMIENGSIYIKLKIFISWGFKSFTRLQHISAFILPKLVHDMVRQKKFLWFINCLWHCSQRDCKGKMKGGSIWCSCLKKFIKNCVKFLRKFIYQKFCIKIVGLNQIIFSKCAPENNDIQEEPKKLSFASIIILI